MEQDRTPALATEEEWILKYRAALDAQSTQQSRSETIHRLLKRILNHAVPASSWVLHRCIRPTLEKASAAVRRELLHFY
jgi:hypothetical protein